MASTTPESTTRNFRVDPNVIRTLIAHQAGSLEKALMEAISNSMDAGAKAIDLTVSAQQVSVQDNGKGLTREEEIVEFFEVFGFDHTGLGREHGRFGVGRGQLFCYGKNTWRTGRFKMTVDINHTGLAYGLDKHLPVSKGMGITIDLYQPLSASELYRLEESLGRLVRHASVPIRYNGKALNTPPDQAKWNHESDEAWFQIRQNGSLSIYSQGLLVKEVSSYHHGVGGTIVTKPGQAFELNMARNDILTQTCPVWKAVAKDLRKLAEPYKEKAERQNTLTAEQRKRMALDALDVENVAGLSNLYDKPLFTLTNGKHLNLHRLLDRLTWSLGKPNDRVGDLAIQMKVGYALHPDTLDRFAVQSLGDLHDRLQQVLLRLQAELPKASAKAMNNPHDWTASDQRTVRDRLQALQKVTTHESTDVFQDLVKVDFQEIPPKALTDDEKAMLHAVRKTADLIKYATARARDTEEERYVARYLGARTIKVMTSDVYEGCTDGTATIWVHRKYLNQAGKGLVAFANLAHLVAHEYTHGSSSQGEHGHDQAFFETFHEAVLSGTVTKAAMLMMASYARATKRKPTAALLSALDAVDLEGTVVFQGDRPPLEDEAPAPSVPAPQEPKPKRGRTRRRP